MYLTVYPVSFMGRADLEFGNKILLPPSALDQLARLSIVYPMLFELSNENQPGTVSHGGVLEFVAEEGRCYVPWWLMQSLLLAEGDIITVRNISLPLGSFVKFKPQSTAFLDISNPKAVLENALRNFATLTQGNIIKISYNDRDYELAVEEVKPLTEGSRGGICVIETDMQVDFSAPVGYVEPVRPPPAAATPAAASASAALPTTPGGLILGGAGGADADGSSSGYDSDSSDGASYWNTLGSGQSLRAAGAPPPSSASASAPPPSSSAAAGSSRLPGSVPAGFEAFKGEGHSLR